jgi:hypothetical protein
MYENEENEVVAVTTGCGCCSTNIYLNNGSEARQEVIDELKYNVKVIEDACKFLGITFDELKELISVK